MIVPTRYALGGLLLAALVSLAAVVDHRWVLAAAGIDLAVIAAVLWQGRTLARRAVKLQVQYVGQLQVSRPGCIQWIVINSEPRQAVHVSLRQAWPASWEGEPGPWEADLGPMQRVVFEAQITPRQRGCVQLPPTELDVTAPLALAAYRRLEADSSAVTVYPDLTAISSYEKLRRSRALRAAGFHQQRMIGTGREFDQLREYLPGDDFRDVNWKATARSGSPQTNLYQAERSRDVILCLDGGRMMGNPVGGRSSLDYAVDAAVLLAHACRDQGDRVGVITFRDRVDTVIRPGTGQAQRVLQVLARFDSQPVYPSYLSLVEALRLRQTQRGLVFILTDLSDPQLAADLVELMPLLSCRHLVVVVALHDTLLEQLAEGPAAAGEVERVLAARSIVRERAEHMRQLSKSGVQVLSADAERLSIAVVNHYMKIKARQLI